MYADNIQHADWKSEKHVPVIECLDIVRAHEIFEVKVTLGKEIAHPNTTEHHIRWIKVYFRPADGKFIHDVASFHFNSHGESVQGPDEGPVYAHHGGILWMKVTGPGTLYAIAYCNIHGIWESYKELDVTDHL